jgi:transcriptional regulator with XRE-family HTH domain
VSDIRIGKNIRHIRKLKKFRQTELARIAGISNTYLSDIENNRIIPSVKTMIKISAALDIDITVLFK